MRMPMMTGYGNDQMEEQTEPVDNPQEESAEMATPPSAGSAGGRTGADVIAGCLAQANVCAPSKPAVGAGTTGPQADMSYGADSGYGV
jgi:hypothetical protein